MISSLLFSYRAILRRKGQALALLLGLFLSVCVCTLVALLSTGTLNSFERNVNGLSSGTDFIVSLDDAGMDMETLNRILDLREVKSALPLLKQKVFASVTPGGDRKIITLLGIDLLNEASIGTSKGQDVIKDPISFMADPKSVAVTHAGAGDRGMKMDSPLYILTPEGEVQLTVGALFEEKDFTGIFGVHIALMDIEAVRLLFKREGKLDQIHVKLNDGTDPVRGKQLLMEAAGPGHIVAPPSELVEGLQSTVRPFQIVLFSMAGLMFGLMLYMLVNLSRNAIMDRRKEFGILRAIGSSRPRLAFTVFVEYGLLAFVGSFGGAFTAWLLAPAFSQKLNSVISAQFGPSVDLQSADFHPLVPFLTGLCACAFIILSIGKNVLATMVISPTEAIQPVVEKADDDRSSKKIFYGFWILLSILPFFIPQKPQLIILPLIASVALGPRLILLLLDLLGKIIPVGRMRVARLSWEYARADQGKVSVKLRGILIGLMLFFMVSLIQSSFENALRDRFVNSTRPDMLVTANGELTSPMQIQPLHESIAKELVKVPGVTGAYGQRITKIRLDNTQISLRAFDEVLPDNVKLKKPYAHFEIIDRPASEAGSELYHLFPVSEKNVAVFASETLKNRLNLKTNQVLTLTSPGGVLRARIVGIIRDISTGAGALYISRDAYKHWWKDELVTGFAVTLAANADEDRIKEKIETDYSAKFGVVVTLDKKLKGDVMSVVERGFFFMSIIERLILFVALLNFLSTFFFEIKSRTKELATLRSIGLSKSGLVKMIFLEVLFLAVASIFLSYALSVLLAWRIITSGLTGSLGWYMDFSINPVQSLTLVCVSWLVITASGLLPALKAQGTEISSALRSD